MSFDTGAFQQLKSMAVSLEKIEKTLSEGRLCHFQHPVQPPAPVDPNEKIVDIFSKLMTSIHDKLAHQKKQVTQASQFYHNGQNDAYNLFQTELAKALEEANYILKHGASKKDT